MGLDFWRDASIVYLALNCFILLLIPMALFYFLVRGMNIVNGKVPGYMQRAQSFSRQMREKTQAYSEKVAGPVVTTQVELTRAETVVRELLPQDEQASNTEEDRRES